MKGSIANTIERKLREALSPTRIEVIDESEQHQGHVGHRHGGETHFRIRIEAHSLAGKSRLDQHRLIHALLSDELQQGVHALAIEAKAG